MSDQKQQKFEQSGDDTMSLQEEMDVFLTRVKKAIEESSEPPSVIAQKCGIDPSSMTRFLSGEQKNFHSMKLYVLTRHLGLMPSLAHPISQCCDTISRPNLHAPVDTVGSDDVCRVPVVGMTGAGGPVELFEMDPDYFIHVPTAYYKEGIVCFYVEGESMEPTIKKGSFVGIAEFDGTLTESAVYLVNLPPFGRTIKRVKMGPNGEILLHSDNPKHETRELPYDGYEQVILGKVVWVLQKM